MFVEKKYWVYMILTPYCSLPFEKHISKVSGKEIPLRLHVIHKADARNQNF